MNVGISYSKDAKIAKYIAVIELATQTGISFNFVETIMSPERG